MVRGIGQNSCRELGEGFYGHVDIADAAENGEGAERDDEWVHAETRRLMMPLINPQSDAYAAGDGQGHGDGAIPRGIDGEILEDPRLAVPRAERAKIAPTEISIPPEIMTKVAPTAMMA